MSSEQQEAPHAAERNETHGEGEQQPPSTAVPLPPPPEDAVKVTDDGGVLKKVLVPGQGSPPPRFSRCLVHYQGRLQSDGSVFMDTRTESQSQQPARVVAGRHSSAKETGLWLAVATMCIGEKALVFVQDPAYGYGPTGNFSFPGVPPNSRLTYEVEMVGYEEPEQPDEAGTAEVSGLLYEERLERAEQRRLQGNQLFVEGKYREALSKYAVALSYMDEDFMIQLEGFYEEKANQVKVPIHLNMAMCQIKDKDFQAAIFNCTEVLKMEQNNAKALFRRGTARHALGQTELALADLQAAAAQSPKDAAISKELAAVHNTMREERKATAAMFRGRLPPVQPQPQQQQQQQQQHQDQGSVGWSNSSGGGGQMVAGSQRGLLGWLARLFGWLRGLLGFGQRRQARQLGS